MRGERLIELFVIRSCVDVDLPCGKTKRGDIVWPRQNDLFGSAIFFESQQIWKTGSIIESGNSEGRGVGGCDDRFSTGQAQLDDLREDGNSYERLIAC